MDNIRGFDLHQFAIFSADYCGEAERCHREQCYNCLGRNDEKCIVAWQKLLSDWHPRIMNSGRLHRLMKKGVPHHLRGTVWKQILQIDTLREKSKFCYQAEQVVVRDQLVEMGFSEYSRKSNQGMLHDEELMNGYTPRSTHVSLETIRDIIVDLDRSYPTHRMFIDGCSDGIEGRASLFRILAGYSRYNGEVGYCQGMSYVAGMLLMNLVEADAFWCLVALMERQRYLRGYYNEHLLKVRRHAGVFQKLLHSKLPALAKHLEKMDITPEMYIIPWFLSLFTNLHCWDSVLAIWDLFILDGMLALFRASLALLSVLETELLKHQDLCYVLPRLLHPSQDKVHYEIFVPILWALTLEDWEVKYMEAIIHEESPHLQHGSRKRAIEDGEDALSPKRARRSLNARSENSDENLSIFQRFKQVFFKRHHSQPAISTVQHNHSGRRSRRSSLAARGRLPRNVQFLSPNRSSEDFNMDELFDILTSPSNTSVSSTPVRSSPRIRNNNILGQRNLNTPTHQAMPKQASMQYSFMSFATSAPLRMSDNFEPNLNGMGCSTPMEMKEFNKSRRRDARKLLKENELNSSLTGLRN